MHDCELHENGSLVHKHVKILSLCLYLQNNFFRGLTGLTEFNKGVRVEVSAEVLELVPDGPLRIGTWNSRSGYTIRRSTTTQHFLQSSDELDFKQKTFVVITTLVISQ